MCAAPSHEPAVKRRSRLNVEPAYLVGGAILLAFVGFVQWYLGWARLLQPWSRLSPAAVAAAAGLMAASYGARAVRLWDYFRGPMAGRFPTALRLTLQHNLWNNLLPMRTGEASFPVLMSRYFRIPPGQSLSALLWFRLLDLHTLVASTLAALGGLWLNPGAAVGLGVMWMMLPWAGYRLGRRWSAAGPVPFGRPARLLQQVVAGLPASRGAFWRAWAWTLVNWAVKFAVLAWVLRQFVHLPPAAAVLGVIAGDATSVLPIHGVAGAGTFEAGIMAGLAASGAAPAPETALAGAVNLHLFILSAAVIGGAAGWCLPGRQDR